MSADGNASQGETLWPVIRCAPVVRKFAGITHADMAECALGNWITYQSHQVAIASLTSQLAECKALLAKIAGSCENCTSGEELRMIARGGKVALNETGCEQRVCRRLEKQLDAAIAGGPQP